MQLKFSALQEKTVKLCGLGLTKEKLFNWEWHLLAPSTAFITAAPVFAWFALWYVKFSDAIRNIYYTANFISANDEAIIFGGFLK